MTFSELNLNADLIKALPADITTPTLVQQQAIPAILHDADVLSLAHTGSGKTLAFGLPILQMIEAKKSDIQAVIIAPTRELARQTTQVLQPIAARLHIKTAALFGGIDLAIQAEQITQHPQLIIATPGRLLALCQEKTKNQSKIKKHVLD